MAAGSCALWPDVNGEPSKLYMDILEYVGKDRMLANLIYAAYLTEGAAKMGSSYPVNSQGEHALENVQKVFGLFDLTRRMNDGNFKKAERESGSRNSDGNLINYTDAKQALEKAKQFNDNTDALQLL